MMRNEEKVVNLLSEKRMHISFAESCTGGLVCATLVSCAGASSVLEASIVTYANEAKIKYLSVSEDTIERYGVVSEQVAAEMARGVAAETGAEVGVSVTGIAGPTGATSAKPVGMVCFGFFINGREYAETVRFGDIGRDRVRASSVEHVFSRLLRLLAE